MNSCQPPHPPTLCFLFFFTPPPLILLLRALKRAVRAMQRRQRRRRAQALASDLWACAVSGRKQTAPHLRIGMTFLQANAFPYFPSQTANCDESVSGLLSSPRACVCVYVCVYVCVCACASVCLLVHAKASRPTLSLPLFRFGSLVADSWSSCGTLL